MNPKAILIVGGTSGIGRALCELYCKEGMKVGVIGRRENLLAELKNLYPDNIETFSYDISNCNCAHDISDFINQLGGIEILILAASVVNFNRDLSYEKEKKTIDINVSGFTGVINAAYHYFRNKPSGQIIAITSIAAARGNKTAPAYNSSKAFQSSYIEGIRLKMLQENKKIKITEIIPGYVNTAMAKGERLFWVSSLHKAAMQIKKAIDNQSIRVFVTKRWRWVYLAYKYLPHSVYSYLINSKVKLQQKH
jgi:short-subunit dehydrogenase